MASSSKNTFAPEQIEEFYRLFELFDSNKDGHITKTEISQIMRSLGYEWSYDDITEVLQSLDLDQFREAFKLFDKNGDGTITTREFVTVLRSVGQDPSAAEIEELVHELDKNDNGTIEFQEFLIVMARIQENMDTEDDLVDVFRVLDQDGDGYITKSDLRDIISRMGQKLTEPDMEEMITEADMDGDNQINFEEFVKIVLSR